MREYLTRWYRDRPDTALTRVQLLLREEVRASSHSATVSAVDVAVLRGSVRCAMVCSHKPTNSPLMPATA